MRAAAALSACLVLALLAGCSGLGRSSAQVLRIATGVGAIDVDAARVAANPHAQLLVEGDGVQALMVLGNDDHGRTSWFAGRQVVFLRGGVLAGTQGFPQDAVEIRLLGDDPFANLHELAGPVATRRRYDWMPGHRFGVELQGTLVPAGIDTIDILGTAHRLQRYDETLAGAGITTTNSYWAEPATGRILRSREFVAPGLVIELVHLKPYRPAVRP